MSKKNQNDNLGSTDKHIQSYHENLRRYREDVSLDLSSSVRSLGDFILKKKQPVEPILEDSENYLNRNNRNEDSIPPSSQEVSSHAANDFESLKSVFGKSLEQLEKTVLEKNLFLKKLNETISKKQKRLDEIYQIESTLDSLANLKELAQQKKEKAEEDFMNQLTYIEEKLAQKKVDADDQFHAYENVFMKKKAEYDKVLDQFNIVLKKKEDQFQDQKEYYLTEINRLRYDCEKISSEFSLLLSEKEIVLERQAKSKEVELIRLESEMHDKLQIQNRDFQTKENDLKMLKDDVLTKKNNLEFEINDFQCKRDKLKLKIKELEEQYSYHQKKVEQSLKKKNDESEMAFRAKLAKKIEDHELEIKHKENELEEKYDKMNEELHQKYEKLCEENNQTIEFMKFNISKQVKIDSEELFQKQLADEKKLFESSMQSQQEEFHAKTNQFKDLVSEKDYEISELKSKLSPLKLEIEKLNEQLVESKQYSKDKAITSIESRYQDLLLSEKQSNAIEVNQLKEIITKLERNIAQYKLDVDTSKEEISKLQMLLSKYLKNDQPDSTSAQDLTIDSESRVIRSSYNPFDLRF